MCSRTPSTPPDQTTISPDLVVALAGALTWHVREDGPDLDLGQLAVLLLLLDPDIRPTVRALAERLRVPRPAITRAADRLTLEGLAVRRPDPLDGRSVLIVPTPKGRRLVRDLAGAMRTADG